MPLVVAVVLDGLRWSHDSTLELACSSFGWHWLLLMLVRVTWLFQILQGWICREILLQGCSLERLFRLGRAILCLTNELRRLLPFAVRQPWRLSNIKRLTDDSAAATLLRRKFLLSNSFLFLQMDQIMI